MAAHVSNEDVLAGEGVGVQLAGHLIPQVLQAQVRHHPEKDKKRWGLALYKRRWVRLTLTQEKRSQSSP
jgi:hypothetical protein